MSFPCFRLALKVPVAAYVRASKRCCSSATKSNLVNDSNVFYSSEVDLGLERKVKKAQKGWEEKKLLLDRSCVVESDPKMPLALQFMYGGSQQIQGEEQSQTVRDLEVEGLDRVGNDDSHRPDPVYPFAIFESLQEAKMTANERKEKQNEYQPAGRRRARPRPKRNAVKKVELEVIGGTADHQKQAEEILDENESFRIGTSDPSVPPSQIPCGGCGAHLHCQDSKLPGFVPFELFHGKSWTKLRTIKCQRCSLIEEHNIALKMNVSPDDYPKAISHIKDQKAIVILVVDLGDFPGSVWPNILELIGKDKRVILVGNKVDLLPQDSHKYLTQVEESMVQNFFKKCKQSDDLTFEPNLLDRILVSARTGFNVEKLISMIFRHWQDHKDQVGGDVFLVGTTNVGKSSLFNLLLDSDLCKVKALDRIDRATTSPVPGTTLSLLKFPIMRPQPARLALRLSRLKQDKQVLNEFEKDRLEKLRRYRSLRYGTPFHPVGQTYRYRRDQDRNDMLSDSFNLEATKIPRRLAKKFQPFNPDDPDFVRGKWCYDTPGTVCDDQIINLLTQEEVMTTLPQDPIRARTFLIHVGQSLLLGGIGRLDLLRGPDNERWIDQPLRMTVFCSDSMPIHILNTDAVHDFVTKTVLNEGDGNLLKVPSTSKWGASRLRDLPPLDYVDMEIDGISEQQCTCDVVLSSIGWVSFSQRVTLNYLVRAWTPAGKGIFLRDPPFLPYAVQLRGKRLKKTPAYRNDKVFIP